MRNVVLLIAGFTLAAVTVSAQAPSIGGLSVNSGPVGTQVTISGSNFGSGTNSTVSFNGTQAVNPQWSASSIQVQVPSGATTGNVVVTVPGQPASNGVPFTVTPNITSLSLSQGPAQIGIDIQGTTFGANPGTVTIGTIPIKVISWNDTDIKVQVLATATTGTKGNVVVTTGSGPSNGLPFTVIDPFQCP